jgi:hypothetical protein
VVDLPDPSRVGGNDPPGTEKPRPGYRKDDIPELGEDVTDIRPVSPVGNPLLVRPGEMAGNPLLHPVLQDLCDRAPGRIPVITCPLVVRRKIHILDHLQSFW